MDSLKKTSLESNKILDLYTDANLTRYDEPNESSQKLEEDENNIKKNGKDSSNPSNLIRENMEDIYTLISYNSTVTNQVFDLETKTYFLKNLQYKRPWINNAETELTALYETNVEYTYTLDPTNSMHKNSRNFEHFISTNATFNNQASDLGTKSGDFFKYLQNRRPWIKNAESELKNLDETVQNAPEFPK